MDSIYTSIIESLIFSSDESLSSADIIRAIKGIDGDDTEISGDDIAKCVEELNNMYDGKGMSFHILKIAGGYLRD